MDDPRPYPWDRLPGESVQEFAQFSAYRFCGSARSVDRAYRKYCEQVAGPDEAGGRPRRAPNSWDHLAAKWQWKERAVAWDAAQIRVAAAHIATLWVTGIELLVSKGVVAARKYNPGEKEWRSVIETFQTVALHLTPEGVRALAETSGFAAPKLVELAEAGCGADDGSQR